MKRNILLAGIVALFLGFNIAAQDKKVVVQKADGTWTVIEYPVGKEVTVDLTPVTTVTGSTGVARVMRAADGTKVWIDLKGVPTTTTSIFAYAIDPAGTPTLLGPITIANGAAAAEFSTPMNQFMLVLSPTEGLTAIDTTTPIFYRSVLPSGFSVIPHAVSGDRVVAVAPAVIHREAAFAYNVPLLNVSTFGDMEREVKLKFTGELEGLEAKAHIDRDKDLTKIRMRFNDMKKLPANKRFTLWTYSPDGQYVKLGHVTNLAKKDEAEIRATTNLADFGLLLTAEDADVMIPTSHTFAVFTYTPPPNSK